MVYMYIFFFFIRFQNNRKSRSSRAGGHRRSDVISELHSLQSDVGDSHA